MANNNYPQITSVTSEALQAQIRALLPSQEGFGTDLMAQNVIVPIIDLTSAASGSATTYPESYLQAFAFGSQTSFNIQNASTTVANTAGFWRIIAAGTTSGQVSCRINLVNGVTTKRIWSIDSKGTSGLLNDYIDIIVYLDSGDSVQGTSSSNNAVLNVSVRQIADTNGVAIDPSGFSPQ